MTLKQIARRLLPPIVIDAGRSLLKTNGHGRLRTSKGRVRLTYGRFILECASSHHLPRILDRVPDFGRNLARTMAALNVEVPRVVDVGANIGDTALLLARFSPGAKVLCVEGDPRFMADLQRNTSQIQGVTLAWAILSDRTSQVRGALLRTKGTARLVLDETEGVVQTRTLDELLDSYPEFSRPDMIKIDTDGCESAILRGAESVLAAHRPVVFYEWDPDSYAAAGEDDVSHADFLRGLGYELFVIFTNIGQPLLRIRRPEHETLESLANFSRLRRSDGWHYDVAAFTSAHEDVYERVSRQFLDGVTETEERSNQA